MISKALEQKILRAYKNWGVWRTASICKVSRDVVVDTLKKCGVDLRTRGWKWREGDLRLTDKKRY